jgi:ring-1,2-phenylacetyl-CoA epoxidase subunit PaaB
MSSTSDRRSDQTAGHPWEVFVRARRGLVHQHVGTVRAATARAAVRSATTAFGGSVAGSIWDGPTGQITTSRPEQKDAFFASAADKAYRHATYYEIPAEVQHL